MTRRTPTCGECGEAYFGEACVRCFPHAGSIHDPASTPSRRPATRPGRRGRRYDPEAPDFFPLAMEGHHDAPRTP
jgi:hypothetical protein